MATPHDKLAKTAFSQLEHARAERLSVLPQTVVHPQRCGFLVRALALSGRSGWLASLKNSMKMGSPCRDIGAALDLPATERLVGR